MTDVNTHSPYRYGADQGFIFGLYLSCLYAASIMGMKHSMPLLSLLAPVMALGVPFLIYRWLRQTYVESRGTLLLSALWMQGIMIFLCGTLIAAAVSLVYLKFINPYFIVEQLREFIDLYANSDWENGRKSAELFQTMIDRKLVPSAVSVVMEMVWLGVFSGSMLSLLIGVLVRARKVPATSRDNTLN